MCKVIGQRIPPETARGSEATTTCRGNNGVTGMSGGVCVLWPQVEVTGMVCSQCVALRDTQQPPFMIHHDSARLVGSVDISTPSLQIYQSGGVSCLCRCQQSFRLFV